MRHLPLLFSVLFVAGFLFGPAGAVVVMDSRGARTIPDTPKRVAVLSWALVEHVLMLDEQPLAVAEPDGYRTWVARPQLSQDVRDVGTRREPNLESLAQIKPDLILISDDQDQFADKLASIAPVLHFDLFSAAHNNYQASRAAYLELGKAFGKADLAKDRLAELDAKLAGLRRKVADRFGDRSPKVTPVSFLDSARVRVHGDNSMAQHALEALGLRPGLPQPRSAWGFSLRKVEDLRNVREGYVIYIEPFPHAEKLFSSPVWKFMPFVRSGEIAAIPPTWTFGGPFSVGYFAEEFAHAILGRSP